MKILEILNEKISEPKRINLMISLEIVPETSQIHGSYPNFNVLIDWDSENYL